MLGLGCILSHKVSAPCRPPFVAVDGDICAYLCISFPTTDQYVLLGAEEGLFSLMITNQGDPVMEQVSPRACPWMRVVENVLIWLSSEDFCVL